MEQGSKNSVYVNMMVDSLSRKKRILGFILQKTREQESLLKDEEMDPDDFQAIIDEKGEQIDELNKIDEGFDTLFSYVEKEINENRMAYRTQIEQMQQLIGEVSELGIQIQALEHQNSGHLKVYLANQRKAIREFNVNSRTTSSYYQNMANAPKLEQSYFFNKTK
ncbi:MAG: flagellar protein FlgN [Eubacterium sp.]|jgi:hypothetical protein|nr:flagellar protein FlgN [Eubacterium sp.]